MKCVLSVKVSNFNEKRIKIFTFAYGRGAEEEWLHGCDWFLPKSYNFPKRWQFTLNLWTCPQKLFQSFKMCNFLEYGQYSRNQSLEEAILTPVLKKIFKRPSTLTSYWRYLLLFYEMNYFSTNVTPIAAKRTSWIPPPGANSSVAAWLPSSERGGGMFAHFQPPTKVVIAHFWMFQGHLGPICQGLRAFWKKSTLESRLFPPTWVRLDWPHCINCRK